MENAHYFGMPDIPQEAALKYGPKAKNEELTFSLFVWESIKN